MIAEAQVAMYRFSVGVELWSRNLPPGVGKSRCRVDYEANVTYTALLYVKPLEMPRPTRRSKSMTSLEDETAGQLIRGSK